MMEVKLCENYFSLGTEEIVYRIKNELRNVNVIIEPCLGYCGDCSVKPYVLINDEIIQGDSINELFEKMRASEIKKYEK